MSFSAFTVLLIGTTLLQFARSKLSFLPSRVRPELPHGVRVSSNRTMLDKLGNSTLSDNLLVDDSGIDVRDFAFVSTESVFLTGLQFGTGQIIIRRILTNGSTAWQSSFGPASANNIGKSLAAQSALPPAPFRLARAMSRETRSASRCCVLSSLAQHK
jgi:hypothetical protein